jgi:hypothetical protein
MRTETDRPVGRHLAGLVLLAVVAIAGPGCSIFQGIGNYLAYNDSCNDFVLGYRNVVWSQQAWRARKFQFCDQPQFDAFGEGFRAGYQDVASGGSGCVPAIPPRKYWTWKYQTAEGQAKVAAWFAGYPYGAQAAQEEGAGNWQAIQVSHLIEMQYSPEFQRGECPPETECYDCLPSEAGVIGVEIIDEQPMPGADEFPTPTPLPEMPPLNSETRTGPSQHWPTADVACATFAGAR